ncbi:uncharacterized protein LOC131882682 isoform X2 [Tigriopus californicus]|uniref:uncharacterized protein LOC131882682 isoform X2 n=1 Tax=Tigriopus californicus TaxID=6832 RepID=UPI0027DA1454|nr:uncharacterized protein LOC131882682 isoform X2 [Tigriopus californicus]
MEKNFLTQHLLVCIARERFVSSLATFFLVSFMNIVRFDNTACVGTARLGICYTAAECEARGGRTTNTCAQGYGVCCIFSLGCGTTSAENCTYFEPVGTINPGSCTHTICPCSSDICQMRLDFLLFDITGPSTRTESIGTFRGGQIAAEGVQYSVATQCLTDIFSVTSSSGINPPSICGVNTNEHMYVDAGDGCNDLVFQIGEVARGNTIPARQWAIKISQFSCDYNNLAPPGCTQYFFNSDSGVVRSYNYDNAQSRHLADQQQVVCVRREQARCRICWSAPEKTGVSVNGLINDRGIVSPDICCAYNMNDAMEVKGYDCISIPGAVAAGTLTPVPERVCGIRGLVTANGNDYVPICSVSEPFQIRFNSDSYEATSDGEAISEEAEVLGPNTGFELNYALSNDNCS